jgi:predicted acyltransferase
VLWILALFYVACDLGPLKRVAFPLVIVGMNPLTMYMMGQLLRGWLVRRVTIHGGGLVERFVPATALGGNADKYLPLLQYSAAFALMWLICYWMYRRRIFLRV